MIETEEQWARLCAGVHWLRLKDRERYAALMRQVKASGEDVSAWNADVKQAAENGLIVTEERKPA